jgi:hypothetical protein
MSGGNGNNKKKKMRTRFKEPTGVTGEIYLHISKGAWGAQDILPDNALKRPPASLSTLLRTQNTGIRYRFQFVVTVKAVVKISSRGVGLEVVFPGVVFPLKRWPTSEAGLGRIRRIFSGIVRKCTSIRPFLGPRP